MLVTILEAQEHFEFNEKGLKKKYHQNQALREEQMYEGLVWMIAENLESTED